MSNLLSTCFFLACIISNALNGHGFGGDTLVLLGDKSWQHIETICKRSLQEFLCVHSYDTHKNSNTIGHVKTAGQCTINYYIRFGFETRFEHSSHDEILCTPTQEFYLAATRTWQQAYTLNVGDELICNNNNTKKITYLQLIQAPLAIYTLEIEKTHTFFVSNHAVLTHNMVLPLAFNIGLSIPIGGATAGTIASMFGPVVCTFGAALGTIGGICATIIYGDAIPKYTITNDHIPHIFYNDEAQAPGQPTEKDGYKPPKKWDGKKVKHPKNGKIGWPDSKGNIWVPTGPGPLAHGGSHWDVQYPNGKDYKNVYPGGHIR